MRETLDALLRTHRRLNGNMHLRTLSIVSLALIASLAPAREAPGSGCGTHSERAIEELYLHRQAERQRGHGRAQTAKALTASAATNRDYGDIAVIDDAGGAVATRNLFNLNHKTLAFIPSAPGAARYRIETAGDSYDNTASESGSKIEALGDDDTSQLDLPFAFPYFGLSYRSLWVNSDGNLTFTKGDANSTDRSLGRFTGGPPRISPLFTDLDPSAAKPLNGVHISLESGRVVVSWQSVPLFSPSRSGIEQSFQIRLFPDGRIEFAFATVSLTDGAVTGISPGSLDGSLSLISLAAGTPDEFSGPVADRFSAMAAVDVATVAQKFYATHEDAYDYLVVYNAVGVQAGSTALAYEVTVRNNRTGYGGRPVQTGADFGSRRRLQAVLNMGPLFQYPADPNGRVPLRATTGDTVLSILGHETGHLFLAFASVADPADPAARPMLGNQLAHWSFNFNSDASLLEGNRIQDLGESASPRFLTTATVQGYSALDQYLMGFRSPEQVPPTFLVTDSRYPAASAPQAGATFNGRRRDITVDDLIAATGRRTPDHTVAQRRYRFAFILITQAGQPPQTAQIAQVEAYRAAFENYYATATSNLATADTALRCAVQLSAAPAVGILVNGVGRATLSLDTAANQPQTFQLATTSGFAQVPATLTLPAGASQAFFSISGAAEGADDLVVTPADNSYETATARVAVVAAPLGLTLKLVSADRISGSAGVVLPLVEVQVTDVNRVPYAGVRVAANVNTGSVDKPLANTDEHGMASFRWTPESTGGTLSAAIEDVPLSTVTVNFAGPPEIAPSGAVNAVSGVPGITPGSLACLRRLVGIVESDLDLCGLARHNFDRVGRRRMASVHSKRRAGRGRGLGLPFSSRVVSYAHISGNRFHVRERCRTGLGIDRFHFGGWSPVHVC